MPRYYFDIRDSSGLYPDEEGIELADLKAAELEAALSLAGMVRDAAPRMQHERMSIEVRGDEGPLFQAAITFDVNRVKH
jgi:uncharacterized protein DUF6894